MDDLDILIDRAMRDHHIPGLPVAVLQGPDLLLAKGYGLANLEHRLPEAWRPVTVRHALSHRSGIQNYAEAPAYWEHTREETTDYHLLE